MSDVTILDMTEQSFASHEKSRCWHPIKNRGIEPTNWQCVFKMKKDDAIILAKYNDIFGNNTKLIKHMCIEKLKTGIVEHFNICPNLSLTNVAINDVYKMNKFLLWLLYRKCFEIDVDEKVPTSPHMKAIIVQNMRRINDKYKWVDFPSEFKPEEPVIKSDVINETKSLLSDHKADHRNVQLKDLAEDLERFLCIPSEYISPFNKDECMYCGVKVKPNKINSDEFRPITQKGRMNKINCVTCCGSCNSSKGDKTGYELLKWLNGDNIPNKQRKEAIVYWWVQNEKYMIIPDNYKNEDGCDWYGLREKLDKASQDYYKSSEEITSIKKFQ